MGRTAKHLSLLLLVPPWSVHGNHFSGAFPLHHCSSTGSPAITCCRPPILRQGPVCGCTKAEAPHCPGRHQRYSPRCTGRPGRPRKRGQAKTHRRVRPRPRPQSRSPLTRQARCRHTRPYPGLPKHPVTCAIPAGPLNHTRLRLLICLKAAKPLLFLRPPMAVPPTAAQGAPRQPWSSASIRRATCGTSAHIRAIGETS
ncbi:hypothetical protein NDU88_006103 [Pleurodeles waltl]|uniref:Secreted protein n=1 Tax=Pleurodeles waltl TaxID=8319 RepID=A0AAV7WCL4_PLEWA|nr:hypothetical protein NDU88_006103 [Pleurodeles waltl]